MKKHNPTRSLYLTKPNTVHVQLFHNVFSPQNWPQKDVNDCSFMHDCFWHCVCSCGCITNPLLLPLFQCHDDYWCIPDCIFIGIAFYIKSECSVMVWSTGDPHDLTVCSSNYRQFELS
ncbi:hypothetical protein E2C01_099891 [Portunus trituberculatus]|uniref:Uncharacterized protein n=1 Tax=Portunus trituberculatus TaxID=210409 RepID=A0A5B7KC36_PORTR|nr:hypothetical protein [Portunus trituberculatus]